MITLILIIILLFNATTPAEPITSSGCLIKLDDKLLMVEDLWSGKYSIPGGSLLLNETPEHGAIRETLEETGLAVKAHTPLAQSKRFEIFSCQVIEDVEALIDPFAHKGYIAGVLSLPDSSRNEIRKIALVDPFALPKKLWRFSSQRELILSLFEKVSSQSNVTFIKERLNDINHFFKLEISWIKTLQSFNHPFFIVLNRYVTKLAEFSFFMIVLPFFLYSGQWRLGIFLLLAIFGSSLSNGLLKDLFELGRPFEWAPEVQLAKAGSFGFPSGHTQTATVFWGLLSVTSTLKWFRVICFSAIASVAFTRIYLGVHFPHDVIGGLLTGFIIVLILSRFTHNNNVNSFFRNLNKVWIYWLIFASVGLLLRFQPGTLFMTTVWFGIMIGLQFGRKHREQYNTPTRWYSKLYRSAIGTTGIFVIVLLFRYLFACESTILLITLQICICFFFVGIWLSWGCFFVIDYVEKLRHCS